MYSFHRRKKSNNIPSPARPQSSSSASAAPSATKPFSSPQLPPRGVPPARAMSNSSSSGSNDHRKRIASRSPSMEGRRSPSLDEAYRFRDRVSRFQLDTSHGAAMELSFDMNNSSLRSPAHMRSQSPFSPIPSPMWTPDNHTTGKNNSGSNARRFFERKVSIDETKFDPRMFMTPSPVQPNHNQQQRHQQQQQQQMAALTPYVVNNNNNNNTSINTTTNNNSSLMMLNDDSSSSLQAHQLQNFSLMSMNDSVMTPTTPMHDNNNSNNNHHHHFHHTNSNNSFATPPPPVCFPPAAAVTPATTHGAASSSSSSVPLPTPDFRVFENVDASNVSLSRSSYTTPPAPLRNKIAIRQRRKNSLWERKNLFCFTDESQVFEDRFHFEPIGEGSFFQVFRATRESDGRVFAVKKSKQLFSSKSDREHYLQEVRSVSMLPPSPHIVEYHRAWQEDLHFFIKMEMCVCTARDLVAQLRARNEMNMSVVWKLLVEMCRGLVQVHSVGLLHLDIKPDNILVGQDSMFKLADFGQAVLRDSWEDGGEGDNRYMAPELLDVHQRPGTSADMFSVGCCILEVATGFNLPGNGPHWHTIRDGHYRSLLAQSNVNLDGTLLLVLDGLLRVRPHERLTALDVVSQFGHLHPQMQQQQQHHQQQVLHPVKE